MATKIIMKNKEGGDAMKKGWKRPLIAVGLAATLLFVSSISSLADSINLENKCSMTIAAANTEEYLADLEDADVVLDVYKVASAAAVDGQDTYEYKVEGAYAKFASDLEGDISEITSDDWKTLSNEIGEFTLMGENTIAKEVNGAPAGEIIDDLDAGLYLVVARSEGLENYVAEVTDEEGNVSVVTIAQSKAYEYTYLPELVSLPTKEPDASGERKTNNPGDWVYDLTGAYMKPERTDLYGDLVIEKTLDEIESSSPVTFVFKITAVKRGETVYSDVAGIYFTGAGTNSVTIEEKIPAGSKVTVEEIYAGASYSPVGETTQTTTILPISEDGVATVSFENTYDGGLVPGYGIINTFDYVETTAGSAEWKLTQTPEQ